MKTTVAQLKFTTNDQLRCIAWTIAFGVVVILFGDAEPRTEGVLIGLGAGMASMWVHLTIVRRELQRLLSERSQPATFVQMSEADCARRSGDPRDQPND